MAVAYTSWFEKIVNKFFWVFHGHACSEKQSESCLKNSLSRMAKGLMFVFILNLYKLNDRKLKWNIILINQLN